VRRHFSETEESFYLNVDFVSHVALVAVADENGQPMIIGGARYVVGEPGQAQKSHLPRDRQISGAWDRSSTAAPFSYDCETSRASRAGRPCNGGEPGNAEGVREKRLEIIPQRRRLAASLSG
jgi:hypothetical protein